MHEIGLFEETVGVSGDDAALAINISQKSVTIPETLDAVRVSVEMQATGPEAVALAGKHLGVKYRQSQGDQIGRRDSLRA